MAQVDRASAPKTATNNHMLVYMAAAPFAVLFALIGLFSISEIKAKKVYSPVALSKLLQSEVYTLPPVPQLQSTRNSSDGGRRRSNQTIRSEDRPRSIRLLPKTSRARVVAVPADHECRPFRGKIDVCRGACGQLRIRWNADSADRCRYLQRKPRNSARRAARSGAERCSE